MLITSTKQVKEKNRRKVAHNIHRYRVSKCENEKKFMKTVLGFFHSFPDVAVKRDSEINSMVNFE